MVYDIIVGRDEEDRKKFGEKGTVFIGKSYVKMGQTTSLANNVFLDVNRPHVILVTGKRGCLTKDTMVLTNKGYKKICDFDKTSNKVYSFNKDKERFELENAELLSYNINEEVFSIKLKNRQEITATAEHPFLVKSDEKYSWKIASKLTTGDKTVSVFKLPQMVGGRMSRRKNTKYISNELFFEDIINITKKKFKGKVYDLRVSKNHSFIANGIISHNSGKSYSLGVIAEQICSMPEEIRKNMSVIIFDTMGIFWTMKYPNKKDEKLLDAWGLQAKEIPVEIYIPEGFFDEYKERGIPVDYGFSIKTSELNAGDWCTVFELKLTEPVGILIERIIGELQDFGEEYGIGEIIEKIRADAKTSKETKEAAENRFLAANKWGIFKKQGLKTSDILKPGKVSVIDLSIYTRISGEWQIKNLVVALVCRKLLEERIATRKFEELEEIEHSGSYLEERTEQEKPLVWVMIDEMHQFLRKDEKTAASDVLISLLREGRQPGISMVLATQQPGICHRDVLTQSDIVLAHRITSKEDIDALNSMMQSYLLKEISTYMNELPDLKGSAIILDDNSERIYPARIKPKVTWHGGSSPTAIKESKRNEILEL